GTRRLQREQEPKRLHLGARFAIHDCRLCPDVATGGRLRQLWWLPLSPVLDARRHVLADQDLLQPFATRRHLGLDDDLDPLRMRAELLARTRRSLRSVCPGRFRSASTAATPVAISSNTKAICSSLGLRLRKRSERVPYSVRSSILLRLSAF